MLLSAWLAGRRTIGGQRRVAPRLGKHQGAAAERNPGPALGAGAATGCGRRPTRRDARWCRPLGAARPGCLEPRIQSAGLPGGVGPAARTRTSGAGRPARSGREALTALEPPGLDDRLPSAGRHAMAEAVALGPLAVVGLERSLHSSPPRFPAVIAVAGPPERRACASAHAARWHSRERVSQTVCGCQPAAAAPWRRRERCRMRRRLSVPGRRRHGP